MFSYVSGWFSDPLSMLRGLVLSLPAVCIGLTVHEWAHAYAAYRLGDPTARDMGRLTLNPLAHFDLLGFLCLMLFGYGWAKPVPIVPRNFRHYRRDDIIVSLAGVTMNFLTAFAFLLLTSALLRLVPSLFGSWAFLLVMDNIVVVNLSLMVFNLIPLSPLDGSHVLFCLCMRRFLKLCLFLQRYGEYILLACVLLGLVSWVLSPAVNWFYGWMSEAAWAIVGLFA